MTTDEAIEFARGWVKAVRDNPDRVNDVYPSRPPITYEILNQLVAAIDGVVPVALNLPERPRGSVGSLLSQS